MNSEIERQQFHMATRKTMNNSLNSGFNSGITISCETVYIPPLLGRINKKYSYSNPMLTSICTNLL